jgi:hypothetical protein
MINYLSSEEMNVHQVIGSCPICGEELHVARLHCAACDTALEGTFALGVLYRLNREQMQFVETFLKNRGSLKDVGTEMEMSYPTVVNRLNDVLFALGYRDRIKPADEPAITPEQRRDVLDRLARGEINADDAAKMIKNRPGTGSTARSTRDAIENP